MKHLREFYWVVFCSRCPVCHGRLMDWSDKKSMCSNCGHDWY